MIKSSLKKRQLFGIALSCLSIILVITACNEEDCQELTEVKINARFYDHIADEPTVCSTLTLFGLKSDSLILNNASSVSNFSLYLRQDTTQTTFVFQFPEEVNDTVTIHHSNNRSVISLDCGCATFFTVDSIKWTHHQIDTIIVKQKEIGTGNEENIRFYL